MVSLWNLLVTETNHYASQYLAKTTLPLKSRFRKWTPVTLEEMENFLDLVLLTKIIKKKAAEFVLVKKPALANIFLWSVLV